MCSTGSPTRASTTAVVNVHHMADQIETHLKGRTRPKIAISDERGELLDTGGGVVKALPLLGDGAVLPHQFRHDLDRGRDAEPRRGSPRMFDPARMDILLLLASTATSIGYDGRGDFAMAPDGRLARRAEREVVPFVYAGAAMLSPAHVRRCAEGRVLAQPHVRPRDRGRAACTACGSKAPGCMSARPRRSRRPRRRSWRAWRISVAQREAHDSLSRTSRAAYVTAPHARMQAMPRASSRFPLRRRSCRR